MDYVDRLTALRQDRDIGQKEIAGGFRLSAVRYIQIRKAQSEIQHRGHHCPLPVLSSFR